MTPYNICCGYAALTGAASSINFYSKNFVLFSAVHSITREYRFFLSLHVFTYRWHLHSVWMQQNRHLHRIGPICSSNGKNLWENHMPLTQNVAWLYCLVRLALKNHFAMLVIPAELSSKSIAFSPFFSGYFCFLLIIIFFAFFLCWITIIYFFAYVSFVCVITPFVFFLYAIFSMANQLQHQVIRAWITNDGLQFNRKSIDYFLPWLIYTNPIRSCTYNWLRWWNVINFKALNCNIYGWLRKCVVTDDDLDSLICLFEFCLFSYFIFWSFRFRNA